MMMGRKQQQQLQLQQQQQQRRHRRQFKLSLLETTREEGNVDMNEDEECSLYVSWLEKRIEENRLELQSLASKRRQQRLDHSHSMERWKKRHAIAQSRFVGYHSHQIPVRAWQPYLYVLERLEEQEQEAEQQQQQQQQQQLRDEEEEEEEYFYVDKEEEEEERVDEEEEDLVTVQQQQQGNNKNNKKKTRRRSSSLETDIDASCSFDPYVVTASFERNNRNNAVLRRHQAQLAYWLHRYKTETTLLERVKNQCSHRIVAMHSFQQHCVTVVLQPRIDQLQRETDQTQTAMEQLQQECLGRMQQQLQSLLDMKQQLRQAFSNQQQLLLFQQQPQPPHGSDKDNSGYSIHGAFPQPPPRQQQRRRSSGLFGFNW